jgi:hypothetical protein
METQKERPTVVVYRRFPKKDGGDVVALFPLLEEDNGCFLSYQHVGQHAVADIGLVHCTRPVEGTEPDVVALHRELEAIGYVLEVHRRVPARHLRRKGEASK